MSRTSWSDQFQASAGVHIWAATGTSLTVVLPCVMRTFTFQTVCTGGSTISNKLQGSLDGVTWYDLATSTSATGDAQHAVDKPSRYLRATIGITGGTTPTVKAYAAASA